MTGYMGQVVETSDSDFQTVIGESEWVLVDFWAPWCGPCKMISPVLSSIAEEREITIAKVNTDVNPVNPGQYGVRGIPTMLLFKDGELKATKVGATTKSDLKSWIEQNI